MFGQHITAFAAFSICTANLPIIERKRGERAHLLSLFIFALAFLNSMCHSRAMGLPFHASSSALMKVCNESIDMNWHSGDSHVVSSRAGFPAHVNRTEGVLV